MASSDEEGEFLPDYVTRYEFVDARDQLISFANLPLSLSDDYPIPDVAAGLKVRHYLHGTTSDGLEQIYKQILAWKYSLSSAQPEIFVLCKGRHWIRLLKPRKRFEFIITPTLVTVHFLHFVKQNPQAPEPFIWSHLSKAFSSYDVQPCKRIIHDHSEMVRDAFRSDMDLQESEYMCALLGEQPKRRKLNENTMDIKPVEKPRLVADEASYIVSHNLSEEEDPEEEIESLEPLDLSKEKELKEAEDLEFSDAIQEEENLGKGRCDDDEGQEEPKSVEEVEDDEELELFDTCCAICDNGGDILCCDGPCMRSFHPTRDSGESNCRSLGLSQAQVDAISVFYCKNCRLKKHQCALCRKLGSSDTSSGAEVFLCVSATCARFYHPKCVAKALYPENGIQARKFEAQVASGDTFTCPVHKCLVCGHGEDRNLHALQFAICRRCPKAYHRKCLPRGISFHSDPERNVLQRAWDDLLPKRILIYCLDHEIIPSLGTPARNHIVFSEISMLKNNYVKGKLGTEKGMVKIKNAPQLIPLVRSSHKKASQIDNSGEVVNVSKARKDVGGVNFVRNLGKPMARPGSNSLRKHQFGQGSSKGSLSNSNLNNKEALHSFIPNNRRPVIKLKNSVNNTAAFNPFRLDINQSEIEKSMDAFIQEQNSSFSINRSESDQRIVSKENLDKSITMGKVKATVKAVTTALEKLDTGCSVEDAMNICGPEMIDQLGRWKHKLQLYLGPFLHGARFTSYGRHFTKLDKLKEIVDMLHWYAQDGDTIVDFSCGSNDFSCLMSKKLETVGKKCLFKNYDLFQPKNDFNFEKRNWFSVGTEELPAGSGLIIGLNPPFGVNGILANQFIDKALLFKPKLLILIVPRETQRLDRKRTPYNLIWEDANMLAGKSFYLPGSIDVNNKQLEQWNMVSPPLSLWSRPDWTYKHREIAMTCNHLPPRDHQKQCIQTVKQADVSNYLMDEIHDCFGDFSSLDNQHNDLLSLLDDVPEDGDGYAPQGS
ncbi:hypothetical protein V2J09_020771 [Rumex salicifolius]